MVERVATVREAIGPDVDLCVDVHARYDVPSAARLAWELEPYNLLWLEEPIPADHVAALRQVRSRSRTPLCVGENLYLRWGFREFLEGQGADIIMPTPWHAPIRRCVLRACASMRSFPIARQFSSANSVRATAT